MIVQLKDPEDMEEYYEILMAEKEAIMAEQDFGYREGIGAAIEGGGFAIKDETWDD